MENLILGKLFSAQTQNKRRNYVEELKKFAILALIFLIFYFLPFSNQRVSMATMEAFHLLQEYVREHVIFCLVPAFFIAGAISIFVTQNAIVKYFAGKAKKWLSYFIASISGIVLAVCSCTILPLFTSIYKKGAGLGPAITFLYSGPAINLLAIVLTARILGWKLGIARSVGAIVLSIVIGLIMERIFQGEEKTRSDKVLANSSQNDESQSISQTVMFLLSLVLILIFATFAKPSNSEGLLAVIYSAKWWLVAGLVSFAAWASFKWFKKEERTAWFISSWDFAKQILPLLFLGVWIAGFMLGRPGKDLGIIPAKFVSKLVGSNSLFSNFIASVVGALMYFATLTEVPIVQTLLGSGMHQGPALALLLAGPALSLPSMLVVRSVLGTKKTFVYITLVVVFSTIIGMTFGWLS